MRAVEVALDIGFSGPYGLRKSDSCWRLSAPKLKCFSKLQPSIPEQSGSRQQNHGGLPWKIVAAVLSALRPRPCGNAPAVRQLSDGHCKDSVSLGDRLSLQLERHGCGFSFRLSASARPRLAEAQRDRHLLCAAPTSAGRLRSPAKGNRITAP